jgi:hypothetical protein
LKQRRRRRGLQIDPAAQEQLTWSYSPFAAKENCGGDLYRPCLASDLLSLTGLHASSLPDVQIEPRTQTGSDRAGPTARA